MTPGLYSKLYFVFGCSLHRGGRWEAKHGSDQSQLQWNFRSLGRARYMRENHCTEKCWWLGVYTKVAINSGRNHFVSGWEVAPSPCRVWIYVRPSGSSPGREDGKEFPDQFWFDFQVILHYCILHLDNDCDHFILRIMSSLNNFRLPRFLLGYTSGFTIPHPSWLILTQIDQDIWFCQWDRHSVPYPEILYIYYNIFYILLVCI